MARFEIISKEGGSIRAEGYPKYSGSYLGVPFLEFASIDSPVLIDWTIGDYIDYYRTGLRYKLYSLPIPKKQARAGANGASFVYSNVKFYSATKELEIAPFRDIVSNDNKVHFSTRADVATSEDVYGIARRIQACMDDIFPGKWKIEVYDTDDADLLAVFEEVKDFSLSNGTCLSALSEIYDLWKNVGWYHTYDPASGKDVITIGRPCIRNAENTSDAFAYGKGKGLTSLKKAAANEEEFATRLYVYGSDRNIQTRYYNSLDIHNAESVDIYNLMIPLSEWGKTNGLPDASKAYLQADDEIIEKYGLIPRTVYFDGSDNEEIYPSIKGLIMSEVRTAMINAGQAGSEYLPDNLNIRIDKVVNSIEVVDGGTKEDMEYIPTFTLSLPKVGFDLIEQGKQTSEGFATISMKSGECAGREFKVKKNFKSLSDTPQGCWTYELERSWDESLGMGFPNYYHPVKAGDEFVLLDIPMPDYYITLAEQRLLEAGRKMLADYTRVSAYYEPVIDSIKIKEGGKLLREGMYMQITDADIVDTDNGTDYVLIDSLSIDERAELPKYSVTLREQKRASRSFSSLEDMIEDVKESTQKEIKRERQYTDRRFRSAQETIEMLSGVFENFTDGISPATVRTMALLIGDESLQFKFTSSRNSLTDIPCPLSYDESKKQMKATSAALVHMTLGVDTITTGSTRNASDYKSWNTSSWNSAVLDDSDARYVYVKASKTGTSATYVLSKTSIKMEEVSGYYHFLVGILNSELNGQRDFVTLYGFTEVLPGQITTDIIRSGNGGLIIDLVNAVIEAKNGATINGSLTIGSGSSGLDNLSEWEGKQQQIDGAQESANKAQSVADSAASKLNQWSDDGIISKPEKQSLRNELAFIEADYNDIYKNYQKYLQEFTPYTLSDGKKYITKDGYAFNVVVANANWTAYKNAYQAYKTDLESKTVGNESVAIGNLPALQASFYKARTDILDEISHSIKESISDYDYLAYTFGKGNNLNVEGVVMSQMVAVKNSNNEVEAFLNGSDFAKDASEHGKLILATGIPASGGGLDARAKEASTRIYEDGCTFTKMMHLEDGCTVGDFKINENALQINGCDSQGAGHTVSVSKYGFAALGTSSDGKSCTVERSIEISAKKDSEAVIRIETKEQDDIAIDIRKGYIAGLRPKIRVVSNNTEVFSDDHTIMVNSSYARTIQFPSNPQIGQEYEFLFTNKDNTDVNHKFVSAGDSLINNPCEGDLNKESLEVGAYGACKFIYLLTGLNDCRWWFYRIR